MQLLCDGLCTLIGGTVVLYKHASKGLYALVRGPPLRQFSHFDFSEIALDGFADEGLLILRLGGRAKGDDR